MASQTQNPAQDSRSAPRVVTYINQQLEKTRRQVKTTDLIGSVLKILFFAGCFLITVALWDSWIAPLSETARWVCFFILLIGTAYFVVTEILPLMFRKINPEYAAKMIEDAEPSFKNSLLNYIFLRKNEHAVSPVIFQAVSRQAATSLSAVPADATVDRSSLIRLGLYLIGLTLFIVSYLIFSPKDPLQSFARVLFPGSKIAHPARVRISDVTPGDTKVFFGDSVTVEAVVRGNHQPDDVYLMVSSTDGQMVNQRIPMEPDSIANRYRAVIGEGSGGIQQALTYQVVALDGETPLYDINVQSQPTIAVESLTIQPPDYTKLPPQTLVGQGEIDVIEGTRITVEAVANLPIKNAYLDLMVASETNREDRSTGNRGNRFRTVQTLNMDADGQSARIGFWAQLDAARERPMATHYQLRFVSMDNDTNRRPNVYPIKIYPDLAPEVRILNPSQQDVEVPEDGQLIVDVEANDLDFEIAYVTFSLNHQGIQLRQDEIDLQPINGNQRVRGRYRLVPKNLGLKSGDRAVFFVTAADNRTTPGDQQRPEPNLTRTDNYTLTVTDPRNPTDPSDQTQDQPNKQQPEQSEDQPEPQQPDQQVPPADQKDDSDQTEDTDPSSEKDSSEQMTGDREESAQDQKSGASDQQEGAEEQSQSGQDQSGGDGQSTDGQADDDPTGQGQPGQADDGSDGSESSSQPAGGQQQTQGDEQSTEQGQPGQSDRGDSTSGSQPADADSASDPASDSSGMDQSQATDAGTDATPSADSQTDSRTADSADDAADGMSQPSDSNADGQSDSGQSDSGDGAAESGDSDQADPDQRQPLSKDATQREQFDRLQELLNDQDSSETPSDPDSGSTANDRSDADRPTGDSSDPAKESDSTPSDDAAQSGDCPDGQCDSDGSSGQGQSGSGDSVSGDSGTDQADSGDGDSGASDSQKGETGQDSSGQADGQSGGSEESDSSQSDSGQSDSGQSDSGKGDSQTGDSQQDGSDGGDSQQGDPSDSQAGDAAGQESDSSDGQSSGDSSDAQQDSGDSSGTPQPSDSQGGDSSDSSQAGSESQDQSSTSQSSQPGQSSSGPGDGMQDSFKMEKEDPNLEHAKKATDLILKRLNEQKYEPDPKLLEEMNWTQEDLNNFLSRWEAMKRAAEQGDARAKRRYEQALRNLNFRDPSQMRTIRQSDEQIEGLSQDSTVIQPPPEFAPGFQATLRDLNRNEE